MAAQIIEVNALVVRETPVGEGDKILTLLADGMGRISARAYGVRSYRSRFLNTSRILCYNQFVLVKKGAYYRLKEAVLIDDFDGLRGDLTCFSLAQYIIDAVSELIPEDTREDGLLALTLNTLFALSKGLKPPKQVKAVFELRAAALAGYLPDLSGCSNCGFGGVTSDGTACGEENGGIFIDIMNGELKCRACLGDPATLPEVWEDGTAAIIRRLSAPVLRAMRHALEAQPARVFAFSLAEEPLAKFAEACELYLLSHIGHGFNTLNFYKGLL